MSTHHRHRHDSTPRRRPARARLAALAALAALAIGAALASCDGATCTLIGCEDEVRIDITGLVSGSIYVVTATGEGATNTCTYDLTGAEPQSECDDGEFGGTDGANGVIILRATPDEVTVTIDRDGAREAEDVVMPDYDVVQPNGEGCEPVCRVGQADVAL